MADILVIVPHPDDAEISCGGTIAAQVRLGASVVVVDATRGELGSRGTPEQRAQEAAAAAATLGLAARENLGMRDGGIRGDDPESRLRIVDCLRRHRPRVVIAMSAHARHPDHVALAQLVAPSIKAAELHGLPVPSGTPAHRGMRLWAAEAELRLERPAFLVPLTPQDWERKLAAIRCYGSQLHAPQATGPETTISRPDFVEWIDRRGRAWGREAGADYAEAFAGVHEVPIVADLRSV